MILRSNIALRAGVQRLRGVRSGLIQQWLRLRSHELSPSKTKCVVMVPHPDDEVFGMGGTIAAKAAAGAAFVFILATRGERSHCDCCSMAVSDVAEIRWGQFHRALAALGASSIEVLELRLPDGNTPASNDESNYSQCLDTIARILTNTLPEEIYYPARNDSQSDHRALSRLLEDAVRQSAIKSSLYRYITWGWYLPSLRFCAEIVGSVIVETDVRPWCGSKQRAIDVYLRSAPAPCGAPYCGRLPSALIRACSSKRELFLADTRQ